MSHLLESLVEQYLSCNGRAFVCPQYEVEYDAERGWGGASPDFVVLDFHHKDLVVVEVTGSSSIDGLLEKLVQREKRWFAPIRETLLAEGAIDELWCPRFLGFVRRGALEVARSRFPPKGVTFIALEDIGCPWQYWDERARGLPGLRPAQSHGSIFSGQV